MAGGIVVMSHCIVPAQRLPDWAARLEALVADRLAQPFEWGQRDCALWAADVVKACTGVDVAADVRGRYADRAGAVRAYKRIGGLTRACDARLGAAIDPALAQVGDIALADEAGKHMLVSNGGGHWMGQGPAGLVTVRDGGILRAWRCTRA
jgi:hypothetical protein